MNLRRWLRPGMGIKRWLLVVFVGELCLALAFALTFRLLYREVDPETPLQVILAALTLQFLPTPMRGVVLVATGAFLFFLGSFRVIRAIMAPFRTSDADQPLVEVIYQKRFLARGPKIVAIGGGTGVSALLRGLKEHTSNLTAVVTVADDGGSSGKLREALGIPPVGDIRNCIVALADAEPLMGELLQYRFPDGDSDAGDEAPDRLGGHAVGNLLIAALCQIEGGDFEEGVRQMNRVLAVRGQVVPASTTPLTLHAELRDGRLVSGQSRIGETSGIERVWLSPTDVHATEDALQAISEADLIIIGPGSLYTSILPSLLLPEIRDAIAAAPALRLYVCNVATQAGETAGYDLSNHLEAIERHTAPGLIDVVLANNDFSAKVPPAWRAEVVKLRWPPALGLAPRLVLDEVVDPENAHHHDPTRLAAAVLGAAEREGDAAARRRARAARTDRTA